MTGLKKEAVRMIEDMQEEQMGQVIALLRNISVKGGGNGRRRAMEGLDVLMEFAGTLSTDFEYRKELAEVRKERFFSTGKKEAALWAAGFPDGIRNGTCLLLA